MPSQVYALDAATGAVSWQFQTGRAITADAVIAASLVLIGSEDSHFYALDAATGARSAGRRNFRACRPWHLARPDLVDGMGTLQERSRGAQDAGRLL